MPTTLARLRPNIESGDRTMPVIKFITVALPVALGLVMIGTGGANFAGPPLARRKLRALGLSGRLSPGGGQPRSRDRFTSADPADIAGWGDRERHFHARRRCDAHP